MSQVNIRAALELAIDSLVGIIPATTIVRSIPGQIAIFETATPHLLTNGVAINVDSHINSVPLINGSYRVTVIGATQFSLKNAISGASIALSSGGVDGEVKANLTAWDNVSFVPVNDVPYQRVSLIFGKPDNPTFGGDHTREIGFMQVTLYYPKDRGTRDQNIRVELIRSLFKHGATFEDGGIVVHISGTPESFIGVPEDNSFPAIVRIPFWADVFN